MNFRPEQPPSFEGHESYAAATHIVQLSRPEQAPDLSKIQIVESDKLIDELSDEASFPGGHSPEKVLFAADASETEVAYKLQQYSAEGQPVVVQAKRTSLTGAAVPTGDVIMDLSRMKTCRVDEANRTVTVGPGLSLAELDAALGTGFFPQSPTETSATVIGAISTNGAGARSYKYGSVRQAVQEVKAVLTSGEVLHAQRGQHIARTDDGESYYFILQGADGTARRLDVPTYKMPDVPKSSAGYFASKDLVDILVGSEGTLGVITEATVKYMEEPPTMMLIVSCDSDEQAIDLIKRLRQQEPEKRVPLSPGVFEPGGISAVEYISSPAIDLVRDTSRFPYHLKHARALVLAQVEDVDDSVDLFMDNCLAAGVDIEKPKNLVGALSYDSAMKHEFTANVRELVPNTVNEFIRQRKRLDPAVTKVGSDPCVRPEDLDHLMTIYKEEFDAAGVAYCLWGHGEGNIHFNALSENADQVKRAKAAVLRAGKRVIHELGGSPMAEHGVGKNGPKQELLVELYGEEGIRQMRALKEAFDPDYILGRGNIFPVLQ